MMTRSIEAALEARQGREQTALLLAVYDGIVDSVARSGGELHRISIRFTGMDVLMTLVARFPAGHMVSHVGSGDLAGCFVRAGREAKRESLSWKADKYRQNGGLPEA